MVVIPVTMALMRRMVSLGMQCLQLEGSGKGWISIN